jgi:hypothetical protein
VIRSAVAVAGFAAWFGAWIFGYHDVDLTVLNELPREMFLGLAVFAPCFLVGVVVGRWWAGLAGLLFFAMIPLPERCFAQRDHESVQMTCYGMEASDAAFTAAVTTPCVLAGVAMAKGWRLVAERRVGAAA